MVLVNLIGSIAGEYGRFLRAEVATYEAVFPHVFVVRVDQPDPAARQNLMLVAIKSDTGPNFDSADARLASYLDRRWTGPIARDVPILTDDHAPVENYLAPIILTESFSPAVVRAND